MKKGDIFERFVCIAVNLFCFSKTIINKFAQISIQEVFKKLILIFLNEIKILDLIRKILSGRILHLCIVLHFILFQAIDKSPTNESNRGFEKVMVDTRAGNSTEILPLG